MNRSTAHFFGYSGVNSATDITKSLGSVIASLPEQAFRHLTVWQKRYEGRLHLESLNDHLIKDMGLSRGDVRHEVSKPFWEV